MAVPHACSGRHFGSSCLLDPLSPSFSPGPALPGLWLGVLVLLHLKGRFVHCLPHPRDCGLPEVGAGHIPFVEADVEMMHRLGAAAEKDLHGHERFPTSPRTPPTKDESDEEAPTTIAAQGNERTKMLKALKGESTRSLVDVLPTLPMRRRGPEAAPLQPVTETPTENYCAQFSYVTHPGPDASFLSAAR